MAKIISLTKGKKAIVDDDDFEYLSQFKWCYHINGYAVRGKNGKIVLMHRVVNKTPDGLQTDHINNNKLDNRKSNLRSCTNAENMRNMDKKRNNTSGFKGVTWVEKRQRWYAQAMLNRKSYCIGYFVDLEEAAKAYDDFVKKNHGDFGYIKKAEYKEA